MLQLMKKMKCEVVTRFQQKSPEFILSEHITSKYQGVWEWHVLCVKTVP